MKEREKPNMGCDADSTNKTSNFKCSHTLNWTEKFTCRDNTFFFFFFSLFAYHFPKSYFRNYM